MERGHMEQSCRGGREVRKAPRGPETGCSRGGEHSLEHPRGTPRLGVSLSKTQKNSGNETQTSEAVFRVHRV